MNILRLIPALSSAALLGVPIFLLLLSDDSRVLVPALLCLIFGTTTIVVAGVRPPRFSPVLLIISVAIAGGRPVSIPFSFALLALLWLIFGLLYLRSRRHHSSSGSLPPSNSDW